MTAHDVIEVVIAVLALIGVLVTPELGRRAGQHSAEAAVAQAKAAQKQAEAAKDEAQAAKDEAAAEMRKAVAAERETASADWARFVDAKDREIKRLSDGLLENRQEILKAQMAIQEADERAKNWEQLYRRARIYLEALVVWIKDNLPGANYPPPPAGLDIDV